MGTQHPGTPHNLPSLPSGDAQLLQSEVLPCVWSKVTCLFTGSTSSLITYFIQAQCLAFAFREPPVLPAVVLPTIQVEETLTQCP